MKDMTFGQLLEKLIYLTNQKKSTLAKIVGYDVSYISKWINEKNYPTQKSISNICEITSEFIVNSADSKSKEGLKRYFEIEEIKDDDELIKYIERNLKESYINTIQRNSNNNNTYKNPYFEDYYNSMIHVNPRLRKQYLSKDSKLYASKSGKLDVILSTNLYKLKSNDKIFIVEMKESLYKMKKNIDIKVRILIGFEGFENNTILNTLYIINMISSHPNLNFEIYNCNIGNSNVLSVTKDNIFHSAIYENDGRCLFTSMSKEIPIVNDMYYSLDEIIKSQGKPLVDNKSPIDMFKEKIYMQYMMGRDLRWILGNINELFMPSDLFMELAKILFKDEYIIEELSQINAILQNIIYKSNLKVLIYESELMRYISKREITFFNIPIKLTLEQMKSHINNVEGIINNKNIEVKLIKEEFVEVTELKPSIYLSKNLKIIKNNPEDNINDYAIIKDIEFSKVCDELFKQLWEQEEEILSSRHDEIIERISKALIYTELISD